MNEHSTAGHDNFGYDPGYPQTYDGDYDNNHDRVTARDIADWASPRSVETSLLRRSDGQVP